VDFDDYGKPLPSPPHGHYWERQENKTWILKKLKLVEELDTTVFTEQSLLEHVVLPSDTIQGICLRYRISATELRRYNMFSGNSIRFKKTLRIPIEPNTPVIVQKDTEEVILQKFKNLTGENTTESKIYLENSNWNLETAFKNWKNDEDFERQYELNENLESLPCTVVVNIPELHVVTPFEVISVDSSAFEIA
jgi:hypothetical protein